MAYVDFRSASTCDMTPGYLVPPLPAHLSLSAVRLVKGEEDSGLRHSLCVFPQVASLEWARGWRSCLYRSGPRERGRKGLNGEPMQKKSQKHRNTLAFLHPFHLWEKETETWRGPGSKLGNGRSFSLCFLENHSRFGPTQLGLQSLGGMRRSAGGEWNNMLNWIIWNVWSHQNHRATGQTESQLL